MARPKKRPEDTKNVSLFVSEKDWELFKRKAQSMGLNRSELVALIAQDKIPLGQPNTETLLLGKS